MVPRLRTVQIRVFRFLVLAVVVHFPAQAAMSLSEYLEHEGIDGAAWNHAALEKPLALAARANANGSLIFAYSFQDPAGLALPQIHIDEYDPETKSLQTCVVDCTGLETQGVNCGSIVGLMKSTNRYIVTTHNNPSANTAIAVSKDGTIVRKIPGTPKALLNRSNLVYLKSKPHFAPFYCAELAVLDLDTGEEFPIYPVEPHSAVRREHIDAVRRVYESRGEAWFRSHNHPGDPERFTEYIGSEVTVSPDGDAIAFIAAYDRRDLQVEPGNSGDFTRVMCVYRNVSEPRRLERVELLLADFEKQFGTDDPAVCVKPEVLDRIFSRANPVP